ncbi:MAG: hypothetical protein J6D03_01150 [Clostridia bacterium]|nr:hypothetical protein [Clostridia bacterium]
MKKYNILYKNSKVNLQPLSYEEIVSIFGRETINKENREGRQTIPTKDCNIIEITIV